ncbi:TRAP-type mannitol/chloroaromatic compound transport system, small permease component [Hartmannibacter diazotrophicus]|uniref:TRAP transporter small permease protein n=1 Tax=Hartmannibacter diazotrophicus TaxID=1482074 RepID=A0A2C9DBA6_9HYPH|nr:TRAP transporter small permease subunit [Hartmannibacter diazotrophicus]SON57577.1 TRAP-type mannitol/chloroaromatic compound transport system, small permease component [Hartmannibacter diazotrophicus]
MQGLIGKYVRLTDRLSDYVGYLAASLIFFMGGTLIFDAVTRNVVKMPVHWAIELTQFTLAAYYFMGGPMTLKNNDHVRMDLFYSTLSERGKAKLDLVTVFCMIFYLGVMLAGGISSLAYAIATDERRFSIWNPSVIPIKSLMVACLVLMMMQAVALVFKHIATLRGETQS